MQPWIETIGIFILADLGIAAGLLATTLKKGRWLLFYLPPLILIILIALTRHFYWLGFYPPFSWVSEGRREYVIFAFTIPMIFSTLIPRLSKLRQKVVLTVFVTIASVVFFVIPFISPILIRDELESIETSFSVNGVCMQTTNYTCGPAAAATGLYRLGIKAEEGKLAIHAYTTPQTGTSDDLLQKAIEKLYGSEGVVCIYRHFDSIAELKGNCPAIVVTKFTFLIDHYVTVLKVTDNEVIIGDPSSGLEELSYEEFENIWRSVGIILKKQEMANNP